MVEIVMDFLGDWVRTHNVNSVSPDLNGQEVILFGWVQEVRDLGGIRFIVMQDCTGTIQITVLRNRVDPAVLQKTELLQKRFSIAVRGIVKKTNMTSRGIEIIPTQIKLLNIAIEQLPIDITGKTPASIEARLDARALDLTVETTLAVFKIRHTALQAIRSFLFDKDYLEVQTPRIIASATEGGAELFSVKYFDQTAYLAQSPQLYKEQLTMSMEKVFEVGSFFRAEESHTRRHLSEFTSVDVEQAFADADDMMAFLEQVIHHVFVTVNKKCDKELHTLKYKFDIPELPFKRLTYTEVLESLKEHGVEILWGEDIPTEAFRELSKLYPFFYFVTDWPSKAKTFYIKPRKDKPEICEGFDLMWRYIELVSGGTRIEHKEQLVNRMQEKGLNPEFFKYHLQTFDWGMPPHAGWAIGLERLTMILSGRKNIRETTLYPRDRVRLTP
ncbi:MAG: aspartate--tRNA(Asn) ligase [Nitrososphaerota archaeon]|jgi:aspartyl-tRNA synthetase|nr:aspartate--tRNA(Asn) ligase [Nitrososphaerota archaeon]